MMYFKNRSILLVVLLIGVTNLFAQKEVFRIIPKPRSVVFSSGKGIMGSDVKYIKSLNSEIPVLGSLLNALPQREGSNKEVGVLLNITEKDVPDSNEGYKLVITDKVIKISAKTRKGLFYGCQTLEQLMTDSRDFNTAIPSMVINDYPAISYRAIHLDTKHHLDRMEYYYKMIDKLASYKINAIIWELEDKLRYERRPEIGSNNSISKQEMQAICRYAKERNIQISPLVQGLGHASYILKHHWNLRENPKSDWELCPSNPETYALLFDLYKDALEAMPYTKYLHIGGDEISQIGIDERCRKTGKNAFELQMLWLRKVSAFAKDHHVIPIFWDDMPLKYGHIWELVTGNFNESEVNNRWDDSALQKAVNLFPKECVYMRWRYDDATNAGNKKILKWYHDRGLKVMGATAAAAGDSPFLPRDSSRVGYIKGFSQLVYKNKLEGILATSWDDGSPHLETVWRGYVAQGEFGWNPNGRTCLQYLNAFAQREYGLIKEENVTDFILDLEKAFFFYDNAFISSGRRNPAWGTTDYTLIELPNKKEKGRWSSRYQQKVVKAYEVDKLYYQIKDKILFAKKNARRNRYSLDIYYQLNELQHFPARMIIALDRYDQVNDEKEKRKALKYIEDLCADFSICKKNLLDVFSKTRFMMQPNGFLEDMNKHNHLAAKSFNSDWIFLYEIPFVTNVRLWINE